MSSARRIYGWMVIAAAILIGLAILSCWPPGRAKAVASPAPPPAVLPVEAETHQQPVLWQVLVAYIRSTDVQVDPAPSLNQFHRQCTQMNGIPRVRLVVLGTEMGPLVFHHFACFPPRPNT